MSSIYRANIGDPSLWDDRPNIGEEDRYETIMLHLNEQIKMAIMGIATCNREIAIRTKLLLRQRRHMFAKLTHAKAEGSSIWAQLPFELIEILFKRSELILD
jgi:hypothetical protein